MHHMYDCWTSNAIWQGLTHNVQPKLGHFPRRSLIGNPSVLLWCSANSIMKTLFAIGRGSKFLLTLKMGQNYRNTSQSAPVTSSRVATPKDFIHLIVEALGYYLNENINL